MHDEQPAPSVRRSGRLFDDFTVDSAENEQDSWLLTYLDTMTLLLVMLVVLLAFSDRVGGDSKAEPLPFSGFQTNAVELRPQLRQEPADAQLQAEAETDPLVELARKLVGDDVEVLVDKGRVSFRVSNEILFPSGQATLTEQGGAVLSRLAEVISASPHDVAVEGHTDDVPIQTLRFPSNWELSTARATSVVRSLMAAGVAPTRLRAAGYAETRPLQSNQTAEGRAANRRVELILESRPG